MSLTVQFANRTYKSDILAQLSDAVAILKETETDHKVIYSLMESRSLKLKWGERTASSGVNIFYLADPERLLKALKTDKPIESLDQKVRADLTELVGFFEAIIGQYKPEGVRPAYRRSGGTGDMPLTAVEQLEVQTWGKKLGRTVQDEGRLLIKLVSQAIAMRTFEKLSSSTSKLMFKVKDGDFYNFTMWVNQIAEDNTITVRVGDLDSTDESGKVTFNTLGVKSKEGLVLERELIPQILYTWNELKMLRGEPIIPINIRDSQAAPNKARALNVRDSTNNPVEGFQELFTSTKDCLPLERLVHVPNMVWWTVWSELKRESDKVLPLDI